MISSTIARGIKTPIIKKGDDLVEIVYQSIMNATKEGFSIQNQDIIGITEAVVSIAAGNYATIDQIALDINQKFQSDHLGIVFPILSRNRFSLILKAVATAKSKLTILLSYPTDEVGNAILATDKLGKYQINTYSDIISEVDYENRFSDFKHQFTHVNMVEYYKKICQEANCQVEFVFGNDPKIITNYTQDILVCSIHRRFDDYNELTQNKNLNVYRLDQVLKKSINGSGYNSEYGLLGSNAATQTSVKLFPQASQELVEAVAAKFLKETGCVVEVLIYGDGAFKDPIGGIWELADPVVSPAYTKGLKGSPNEVKLKYLADNEFANLSGEELALAIKQKINDKASLIQGSDQTLGTTPRRYIDLIGSLCDLVSGSGDKGAPVVYIQNYFTNYTK